jgi:hypothetical protein
MASALSALLVLLSSSAIAFTPPQSVVPSLTASRLATCLSGIQRNRLGVAPRAARGVVFESVRMAEATVPKIIQGGMGVQV